MEAKTVPAPLSPASLLGLYEHLGIESYLSLFDELAYQIIKSHPIETWRQRILEKVASSKAVPEEMTQFLREQDDKDFLLLIQDQLSRSFEVQIETSSLEPLLSPLESLSPQVLADMLLVAQLAYLLRWSYPDDKGMFPRRPLPSAAPVLLQDPSLFYIPSFN